MKHILTILFFKTLFTISYAQQFDSKFDTLVASFGGRVGPFYKDTLRIPEIYKGEDFSIQLADNSLELETEKIVIKNPYSDDPFPLSYSVIFDKHLISLFKPGYFVCHRLNDLSRNFEMEKILNKKKFKSHSIIDGKLHGKTKFGYWKEFSDIKWKRAIGIPNHEPFKTHLYNDNEFIVYSDCNGEWGGTLYFYNRLSKETYYTSATCANTVTRDENGFRILSHLGHGGGSADYKLLKEPNKLPNLKYFRGDRRSIVAIGNSDSTNFSKEIFNFYWIQIFSTFHWEEKQLYIVHWQERTFLAEINESKVFIVHPLFDTDLYSHDPITKRYDSGEVLINLDHYGTGGEREVSIILIKGKEITKINWDNSQDR